MCLGRTKIKSGRYTNKPGFCPFAWPPWLFIFMLDDKRVVSLRIQATHIIPKYKFRRQGISCFFLVRARYIQSMESIVWSQRRKLKRMRHIFPKMLEIPIPSDSRVDCLETDRALTFVYRLLRNNNDDSPDDDGDGREEAVTVEVVEIVEGAKKLVVRGLRADNNEHEREEDGIESWRYRMPAVADLESATATLRHGVLKVVIPKHSNAASSSASSHHHLHVNPYSSAHGSSPPITVF